MRRIRLGSAPRDSGRWAQTLRMPGGIGAAPCACADLGVQWSTGGTSAAMLVGDEVPLVLAATGTICADTRWTLTPMWEAESDAPPPTLESIGAAAWRVSAAGAGIMTIAVDALCGGARIVLPSVSLVVLEQSYSAGGCNISEPESWSILDSDGNVIGDTSCSMKIPLNGEGYEGGSPKWILIKPNWPSIGTSNMPPDACNCAFSIDKSYTGSDFSTSFDNWGPKGERDDDGNLVIRAWNSFSMGLVFQNPGDSAVVTLNVMLNCADMFFGPYEFNIECHT